MWAARSKRKFVSVLEISDDAASESIKRIQVQVDKHRTQLRRKDEPLS